MTAVNRSFFVCFFRSSSQSSLEAAPGVPSKAVCDREFEVVELHHLKPIATLGVGGFGRVELVIATFFFISTTVYFGNGLLFDVGGAEPERYPLFFFSLGYDY